MIGLRRALIALAVAGFGFGLALVAIIAASKHTPLRGVAVPLVLITGWGFIGAGLFAWWRRPDNNFGPLMTSVGFLYFISQLFASEVPLIFAAGHVLGAVFFVAIIHMLLAMPEGRLRSRAERGFVVGIYVFAIAAPTIFAFFADPDETGCDNCPRNVILIDENEDLANLADLLANVISAGLVIVALTILVRRWRNASAGERRALGAVLVMGSVVVGLIGFSLALRAAGATTASDVSFYVTQAVFALVPYVFLGALARSRLMQGGAVSDLVARLTQTPGPGEMRDALARAVGDPTLELAYWVGESDRYVDVEGHPVELPEPGSGRAYTYVELDGRCVAAMIHDEALSGEEELMAAVGTTAAFALENERLDAELRCRLEDLHASRARLVEAGVAERRRLERDLHDGAQQRLVSLALDMRLARSKAETDPHETQAILDRAGEELGLALAELRELARGIHPAVLSDRGLGAALESLAGRAPVHVDLDDRSGDSLPEAVESAAYFVVAEALTNVAKYANASRASVEVARENGDVLVRVTDDGVGGADPQKGSGLRGLSDRVATLDGRLWVDSAPGAGTTVRARLPCA